ncbi:tetrahydrocannabinolic acid synthase-like [Dorcoceras hygrometricum]|uniref:Tetrahydrocannabinolic acid synthase-like n=1 Tax=Dorcoceras hygrometricum TaxID=472368 RepID=A0A2Z7APZ9_9LAMI|nr:tetrahydrocannabinolic acid synthase-like [Dorcoceras hygrometricum]
MLPRTGGKEKAELTVRVEVCAHRIFDRSILVAAEKSFHCEMGLRRDCLAGASWIHSGRVLMYAEPVVDQSGRIDTSRDDSSQVTEKKRKRPKGKRAMIIRYPHECSHEVSKV